MEMVDIYDRRRQKTGRTKERHSLQDGEYRISTHIWILDGDRMLIQQRSFSSRKFPGLWSQTGGAVDAGENSLQTVIRECEEELGLKVSESDITFVGSFLRTNDIVDVYLIEMGINLSDLKLQESEVNDVKMVTFAEFDRMIESGQVVPSINPSYEYFKNYINMFKGKSTPFK